MTLFGAIRPVCRVPMLTTGSSKVAASNNSGRRVPYQTVAVLENLEVAPLAQGGHDDTILAPLRIGVDHRRDDMCRAGVGIGMGEQNLCLRHALGRLQHLGDLSRDIFETDGFRMVGEERQGADRDPGRIRRKLPFSAARSLFEADRDPARSVDECGSPPRRAARCAAHDFRLS